MPRRLTCIRLGNLKSRSEIRICFIGDSLVNGTGDEAALGWDGRLCAMANASDILVTYYNLGIRRNTSKDILLHWESEYTLRLPDSYDGRIVLSCGVNDTTIENGKVRINSVGSCANVRAILRGAKRYTVLMVGPSPVLDDEQNERIESLSFAFAHETQVLGVPYVDLFSALCLDDAYKREILRNDGSHPRSEGYSKMAHIISSSSSWWFHASNNTISE